MQKSALLASCAGYDAGNKWEALRLATTVYTLLHDGRRKSNSILTQMGRKTGLKFVSSIPPLNERNMIPVHDLVLIEATTDGAAYKPCGELFRTFWRSLAFSTWWENDPIFSSGEGKGLVSRMNLVFNLRNKDGGAHFDPSVEPSDYDVMAHEPLWAFSSNQHSSVALGGLQLASMRQVAFEVVETFKSAGL